jgi:hypothetical protein
MPPPTKPHDVTRIHAEPKLEQHSIGTTAAQTIANAAAEKAAAGADAPERAVAEQTVAINAVELAAINADAEAAATINNLQEEIEHMRLLLTAERDATAVAKAAADEAAATINKLEVENKRILLLLAAEQAATAVKVYVPGYNNPMTQAEYVQALQRQIQYLQEQLHAQAIPAQWPSWQRLSTLRRPWHPAVWYQHSPTSPHGRSTFDLSQEHCQDIAKSNPATMLKL